MRSSKSRSRSKQNRPRTIGNIVNRVFDSSGPDGKVRGTPQQIIEKYQALARDAQLSNDRVAAENFLQHAEHYTRMLGEAMREMAAEQEARRQFQGQHGNGNGNGHHQGGGHQGGERPSWQSQNRRDDRVSDEQPEIAPVPVFPFEDADAGSADVGLVETPEDRAVAEAAPVLLSEEPAQQPREPRSGERQPREQREPRAEGQRRSGAPKREDDRRQDAKRENRRKDDRRSEERKPRDVAVVEAEAVSTEAPGAEAEKAPRAAAKPRRAPATRTRAKAAADADAAPVTQAEE